VPEHEEQLDGVEPRVLLIKLLLWLEVVEQLAAVDALQDEVERRL
jgi:hypothetical protein